MNYLLVWLQVIQVSLISILYSKKSKSSYWCIPKEQSFCSINNNLNKNYDVFRYNDFNKKNQKST